MKNTLKFSIVLVLSLMMMACIPADVEISTNPDIARENTINFKCNDVVDQSEGIGIAVWRLTDGYCYPVGIFSKPTKPDECVSQHFHYPLLAIGGHERSVEDGACGMAAAYDFDATGIVYVKKEMIEKWNSEWENLTTDEDIFGFLPVEEEVN